MLSTEAMDVIEDALIRARQASWRNNSDVDKAQTRRVDAALAELAALRQGQWQPIVQDDYWGHFNVERDGRVVTVATDAGLEMDKGYIIAPLPRNVYVCRRFVTQEATNG